MGYNISLAVRWPAVTGGSNQLSHSILSIPLDSRYDKNDMKDICQYILSEENHKK